MTTVLLPCRVHGEVDAAGNVVVEVPLDLVRFVPVISQETGIATYRIRAICTVAEPHIIRWDIFTPAQREALFDLGVQVTTLAEFRAMSLECTSAYACGAFPARRVSKPPAQWKGPDAAIDEAAIDGLVAAFEADLDGVDADSIADRALAQVQEVTALRNRARRMYAEHIGSLLPSRISDVTPNELTEVERLMSMRDAFMNRTLGGAS